MQNEVKSDARGKDWALYLGGPSKAPRRLRDVIARKIDALISGDEFIWATYYFCDLDLAKRLILAHDRGVRVRLTLSSYGATSSRKDTQSFAPPRCGCPPVSVTG